MKNHALKFLFFVFTLAVFSCNKNTVKPIEYVNQTEQYTWGIHGNIVASKSLNKSYNFYFDQFDGSPFDTINCGPTVATMAIVWKDSSFNQTPLFARSQIKSSGGWWSTDDMMNYLSSNNIYSNVEQIGAIDEFVKSNIDQNKPIILCLDMFYVRYNANTEEHVNKFYQDKIGSGHFLLVKGYIKTDIEFYLEVYDPNSWGQVYYSGSTVGSLKGKNRFYLSDDIKSATDNWWQYAIVVDPNNTKVLALNSGKAILNPKSIPIAHGK